MKKQFFFFLLSIFQVYFCNNLNSQVVNFNNKVETKIPPGTIYLNDSLFIDKTPISNIEYLFFLSTIKHFWSLENHDSIWKLPKYNLKINLSNVKNLNPNNMRLYIAMSINESFNITKEKLIKEYLHHPNYNDYPLLQITKQQAEMYCLWRTDIVLLNWAKKSKTKQERDQYPQNIKYRLPTTKELKNAIDFFKRKNKLRITKEKSPLKFKVTKSDVFSLYNISEFTLDSIPFGKNWKNSKEIITPNDYTGFRCICEIKNGN
jgi:hypothetical protein